MADALPTDSAEEPDKERYERGLGNMGVDNDPEFGSEEARWEYRFFLSRGLNAFCRMRLQQIELKRQGTRKPQ